MLTCIGGATSVEAFKTSSAWMAREERESPEFWVGAGALSLRAGSWPVRPLAPEDIMAVILGMKMYEKWR